jgi:hypothetical protein
MFGKIVSKEIEVRDGKSYEKTTFDNDGAISTQERVVVKSSYDKQILNTETQLKTLLKLQEDALD